MLFVDAETRASPGCGRGCFTRASVTAGSVVAILVYRGTLVTENEYLAALAQGSGPALRTGTRWVGPHFTIEDPRDRGVISDPREEFINHSFDPTLLFHCGICFARRDLAAGEELTVNYEYVLSENDPHVFRDAATGRIVRGLPWPEALRRSAAELVRLTSPRKERAREDAPCMSV